jgi:hypothetical protein
MLVEVEDPLYVRKILAAATSKNVPSMAQLVMREALAEHAGRLDGLRRAAIQPSLPPPPSQDR